MLNVANGERFAMLYNQKILGMDLEKLNKSLNDVYVAKNPVMTGMLSMMIAKNVPYANRIIHKIKTLADAGLVYKWLRDADKTYVKSQQIYRKDPIVLQMEHIWGSLYMLFVGSAISMFAFFIELFRPKFRRLHYRLWCCIVKALCSKLEI